MSEKKILVEDVEPLIDEKKGNVAAIARALGVARNTVYARIQESATLQKLLADARETMLDNAESVLYSKVLAGDVTSLIFFLKTKGKSRGYTESVDLRGPGKGGAIETQVEGSIKLDLSNLTAEQLTALAATLKD